MIIERFYDSRRMNMLLFECCMYFVLKVFTHVVCCMFRRRREDLL